MSSTFFKFNSRLLFKNIPLLIGTTSILSYNTLCEQQLNINNDIILNTSSNNISTTTSSTSSTSSSSSSSTTTSNFPSIPNTQNILYFPNSSSIYSKPISSYTYPANNPIEDRHIYGYTKSGWKYAGVFDGHGGWQVSEFASKNIMNLFCYYFNQFEEELAKKKKNHNNDNHNHSSHVSTNSIHSYSNEKEIDNLLTKIFNHLEELILSHIRPAFSLGFSDVAKVGSCVLMSFYKDNHLILANCGDCRAVLGSISSSSPTSNSSNSTPTYYATALTREHNSRIPYEQLQLYMAHPNEDDLVICKSSRACYVKKRLQLTRSLGDSYLKYKEFNGNPKLGRAGGRYIPEPYTPPYVSHIPDVHHIRIRPEDKFLILGTDGLWDVISSEEAVTFVSDAIARGEKKETIGSLLVTKALEVYAMERNMTLKALYELPLGKRRSRHDDTTVVVLFF